MIVIVDEDESSTVSLCFSHAGYNNYTSSIGNCDVPTNGF